MILTRLSIGSSVLLKQLKYDVMTICQQKAYAVYFLLRLFKYYSSNNLMHHVSLNFFFLILKEAGTARK